GKNEKSIANLPPHSAPENAEADAGGIAQRTPKTLDVRVDRKMQRQGRDIDAQAHERAVDEELPINLTAGPDADGETEEDADGYGGDGPDRIKSNAPLLHNHVDVPIVAQSSRSGNRICRRGHRQFRLPLLEQR